MAPTRPAKSRFLSRLNKEAPGGCWLWTGARSRSGYGVFTVGRRNHLAHRFAYECFVGDLPNGKPVVRHLCGNRLCCNYEGHLVAGTHKENAADRAGHGRSRGASASKFANAARGRGKTLEEKFWLLVDVAGGLTACWPWRGFIDHYGYGLFRGARREQLKAHRFSLQLAEGQLADDVVVRHRCNNRACVNPRHLEVGTRLDNSRDMVNDGRSLAGEANPRATLTASAVKAMREAYSRGEAGQAELAKRYGVRQAYVSRVLRGETWADAGGPRLRTRDLIPVATKMEVIALSRSGLRNIDIAKRLGLSGKQVWAILRSPAATGNGTFRRERSRT